MKLASLLEPRHVRLGLEARTLKEAIPELLEAADLDGETGVKPGDVVLELLRRQQHAPSTLGQGLAAPHARLSGLRGFHVLLGRPLQPLQNVGPDGAPVDLVFLVLGNNHKTTQLLQTLAAIARLGDDPECLAGLRAAHTRDEAWNALDHSTATVKQGLHARDLMRPAHLVARADMQLDVLLDLFVRRGVCVAPVCAVDGAVIGSVTSEEVLEMGYPAHLARLTDLQQLDEFEPFGPFFTREATMLVGDVHNTNPLVVDAATPLIQVLFLMRRDRQRWAFVEDQGRLAGIIDRDDIVSRVLRA